MSTVVLRIRIVMYSALIVLSFFIFINIILMQVAGHRITLCPLFVTGYSETTTVKDPPPGFLCGYILTTSIIFQLVYLGCRVAMLIALEIGQLSSDFVMFKDEIEFAYVVTEFVGFVLTLIGAIILALGLSFTCGTIRCDKHDYDFETPGKVAKIAACISTPLWLVIFLIGFIFLYRAGKIPFLKSGGSKPPGSKPPGSKPAGSKQPGSKPAGNKPPGSKPPGSKPPGNKPPGSKPPGSKPLSSKPPGSIPPGSKPPGSKPPGSKPPGSKPPGSKPPVSRPPGSKPPGSKPPVSRPPDSKPPGSKPPVSKPSDRKPPGSKPPGSKPPGSSAATIKRSKTTSTSTSSS